MTTHSIITFKQFEDRPQAVFYSKYDGHFRGMAIKLREALKVRHRNYVGTIETLPLMTAFLIANPWDSHMIESSAVRDYYRDASYTLNGDYLASGVHIYDFIRTNDPEWQDHLVEIKKIPQSFSKDQSLIPLLVSHEFKRDYQRYLLDRLKEWNPTGSKSPLVKYQNPNIKHYERRLSVL